MNCREVRYYLNDYADGHLIDEIRSEIEDHLKFCYDCKCEYNDLCLILSEAKSLPKTINPSKDLWEGISARISGRKGKRKGAAKIFSLRTGASNVSGYNPHSYKFKKPGGGRGRLALIGSAVATVILGILIGILYYYNRAPVAFLSVENLAGTPVVGTAEIKDYGMLKIGEWLRTNESSSARLKVGSIGEVDVYPQSRVKLVQTLPSEYRISLDRGKIEASIWAPPRLFFVETPSATAIDLGCIYTLEVDDKGSGLLKVSSGWVALEFNDRESLIPSDAVCRTKRHFGPGTPYFKDAPVELVEALYNFDFNNGGSESLDIILSYSRKQDALSLWHILARADGEDKIKTFNRLAELSAPPTDVTLEGIVDGDRMMLNTWWETLGYGNKSLWDN
jgi:hypothetical protein